MQLRDKLNNIKESEIYKLVYEGEVIGLRVKSFDVNYDRFNYYDFELSLIKDQHVINFINSIKDMGTIELKQTGTGLLMSDMEIKQKVIVGEFESEADAVAVLRPFIRIYKYKEA
jgi:hypothetical protein